MPGQRQQSDRFAGPEDATSLLARDPSADRGDATATAEARGTRPKVGLLRKWPPILWVLVYIASILVLNGSNGQWSPAELAAGIGLALIAFGLSMYLAFGPWPGRPRPTGMYWFVGGVAGFYATCALAAAIFASFADAIATLLAAIIPMTGVALWVAGARAKTVKPPGRHADVTTEQARDSYPGMGVDDARPLGDTPEAHDEITPRDLPRDHPGRIAAERQAEELGGVTRGHREGAAADVGVNAADTGGELVERDEKDGARIRR